MDPQNESLQNGSVQFLRSERFQLHSDRETFRIPSDSCKVTSFDDDLFPRRKDGNGMKMDEVYDESYENLEILK